MKLSKPYLLCILDGFGLNPNPHANAVHLARKPNFDALVHTCPNTTLITFGERVGLPAGQMGNSEVGHLNIGAGRVVEQWLLRIQRAFERRTVEAIPAFLNFIRQASGARNIHVMGLFSDGGVHSHSDHLYSLLPLLMQNYSGQICLHLITDGRDTAPNCAAQQLEKLEAYVAAYPALKIATVSGRFYAMDRDKRWERTVQAYNAVALGKGIGAANKRASEVVRGSYASGIGDEFIEPVVLEPSPFEPNDAFVFFNFREDRARQIVAALCSADFNGFVCTAPKPLRERVLCFTQYDDSFDYPYLFELEDINNHLGEVVSNAGLRQLRTAETEKYPHVTYFLNGGIEEPLPGEHRVMIPSPRDVKTYDLKPEMSAFGVTSEVVKALDAGEFDLIVVNLANCDMVGHTGILAAAVKAVETVDICLGQMLEALRRHDGEALILADHGNADQMLDYETGQPHTAHTTHPVPCIVFGNAKAKALNPGGALCDVAPTLLEMMGIAQPAEMTGRSLLA